MDESAAFPAITGPGFRPEIESLPESGIVEVWKMGFKVPDVIGLWVGEGDLPTPDFICEAAARSLKAGNTFYTHKRGIPELRQALADYHARHHGTAIADDRITVTSAGMNAMMMIVQTLVGAGDNAVIVTPIWPNIFATVQIMGGEVRQHALRATPGGWTLDLEGLFQRCDARTKAIYVASPGNPTGWLMERHEQQALLDFCRRRGIHLIADEVYHRFVYDGRTSAPSFLSLAEPDDPLFVVNSFSKSWAMTGWRVGWIVAPRRATPVLDRLIEYNTSGGVHALQSGCLTALTEGESFARGFVERCRQGRDIVVQRLSAMKKVRIVPAPAAFYLMLQIEGMEDATAFAKKLVLEAKVGLAPGTAFGAGGEGHLRLCYASQHETLRRAMDRLEPLLG